MTAVEQIADILERRRGPVSYRWLIEAVELLLRLELERQAQIERKRAEAKS